MSVAKTVEIVASSTAGVEDAVGAGIAKAAETINNIEGAWIIPKCWCGTGPSPNGG